MLIEKVLFIIKIKNMKMKKLLSVVFLFSLIVSFISVTPNVKAIEIPEGATIKTVDNPDVYIVKYKNGKQFKRLVLNPQVFESYGHLRWEDILTVDQSVMDSFVVSDLVRVDGQTNIYQLMPNGDVGTKTLLESTVGYDLDSVYTINAVDFGNYVICSYDAYNCSNFSSQAEAQRVFDACGGIGNDIHKLDYDNNGVACESL